MALPSVQVLVAQLQASKVDVATLKLVIFGHAEVEIGDQQDLKQLLKDHLSV